MSLVLARVFYGVHTRRGAGKGGEEKGETSFYPENRNVSASSCFFVVSCLLRGPIVVLFCSSCLLIIDI